MRTKATRAIDWSRAQPLLLAAAAAMLGLSPLAMPDEARAARESAATAPPAAAAAAPSDQACRDRNRRRGRVAGGALGFGGGLAGGLLGGHGGRAIRTAALVTAATPAGALLGDAIAGLLDCDEQQRAAGATETAIGGGVGTTTAWASATRPGVTGSSTVNAAEAGTDGSDCMTVTDVVIIDGEETRAPKRLCRRPPNNRYARV
jgi:hypothetical protein